MVGIWAERNVFEEDFISTLQQAIGKEIIFYIGLFQKAFVHEEVVFLMLNLLDFTPYLGPSHTLPDFSLKLGDPSAFFENMNVTPRQQNRWINFRFLKIICILIMLPTLPIFFLPINHQKFRNFLPYSCYFCCRSSLFEILNLQQVLTHKTRVQRLPWIRCQ